MLLTTTSDLQGTAQAVGHGVALSCQWCDGKPPTAWRFCAWTGKSGQCPISRLDSGGSCNGSAATHTSGSMLHRTMWLKCATATLYLLITRRLSILTLVLLQLVLVVRMHFVVGSHRTVCLLIDSSFGILVWLLFGNYNLFRVLLMLTVILRMEIGTLLECWSISIVFHFVIALSSLGRLITLLIWTLSSGRIVYAVFVLLISFVFIGNVISFLMLTWLSQVRTFVRWFVIVHLNNTSLVGRCLLS